MTSNTNGVLLHENKRLIVVATGLNRSSENTKTGEMIQLYVLNRSIDPVTATKTGADEVVCGDCMHRGEIIGGKLSARRCYVNVGQAPRSIFSAYHRGSYRKAKLSDYPALFENRVVRFGAYGDPVHIPMKIVKAIVAVAANWTGYTHQWRNEKYGAFKSIVMASADNVMDYNDAVAAGWRTFRVRANSMPLLPNEIVCPASAEAGKRTTCDRCKLCNGKKQGAEDTRKNIAIIDHSVIAKSNPLVQIGAA